MSFSHERGSKMSAPLFLSASTLVGDPVMNPTGEKVGELKEIMLDVSAGRIAYGVLSFGGLLGIGEKLFALPWRAVSVDTDNHAVVVDVTKEQLETAPGFDPENWPLAHDADWVGDVYEYYGHEKYWEAPLT
jgi:sporulation protein YlmC with PRC-barrel domain